MRISLQTANLDPNRLICKIVATLLVFLVVLVSGGSTIAMQTSAKDTQIVNALEAIKNDRWDEGRRSIAASKDPLAATLYYWLYYQQKANSRLSSKHYIRFLNKYPDWPGQKKLRLKAEKAIGTEKEANEIIRFFDRYEPLTVKGFFVHVDALLAQGKQNQAKALIEQWWIEKPLGRKDQKALFRRYKDHITLDSHRKRLDRLLFDGSYANARAVAQVLEQGYPELTEARIALASKKQGVSALIEKVPAARRNDPGLLYERLRWRRRNDQNRGAVQILLKAPPMDQAANPADWWMERHIMNPALSRAQKV